MTLTQKVQLLRTKAIKRCAEKRLRPAHGDDWEEVFQSELKRKAKLSQLELQVSNMGSRDIAEWIYELEEKQNGD